MHVTTASERAFISVGVSQSQIRLHLLYRTTMSIHRYIPVPLVSGLLQPQMSFPVPLSADHRPKSQIGASTYVTALIFCFHSRKVTFHSLLLHKTNNVATRRSVCDYGTMESTTVISIQTAKWYHGGNIIE